MSRTLTFSLLASLLLVGSFVAGLLLMSPSANFPLAPETLAATPPTTSAATTSATAAGLTITRALYGDLPDGPAADVTEKVADHVSHDTLSISASNDLFGDPAEGIVKKLRVDYTYDGKPLSKTVNENETLSLKFAPPSRLLIKHATYGDPNGPSLDVTEKVAAAIRNDSLSIAATNENFTDPAEGTPKTLRVDYTLDGKFLSQSVAENETLSLGK